MKNYEARVRFCRPDLSLKRNKQSLKALAQKTAPFFKKASRYYFFLFSFQFWYFFFFSSSLWLSRSKAPVHFVSPSLLCNRHYPSRCFFVSFTLSLSPFLCCLLISTHAQVCGLSLIAQICGRGLVEASTLPFKHFGSFFFCLPCNFLKWVSLLIFTFCFFRICGLSTTSTNDLHFFSSSLLFFLVFWFVIII